MSYVDALVEYMDTYGVDDEEAERLLDSDLNTYDCTPDDLREWQLANTGMTEADLPYSMRTVSLV